MMFENRKDAGYQLAQQLLRVGCDSHCPVFGLARGGMPVAAEVAAFLGSPLDVFVVRKLGLPGHEELAIGAIAPFGVCVLNQTVVARYGLDQEMINEVTDKEQKEIMRRLGVYRKGNTDFNVACKDILIVDDGAATGATMKVAVDSLRKLGPASIHVGLPVASSSTCAELKEMADSVVCLHSPKSFFSVGQFYHDFPQTTDEEILALLSGKHSRQNKLWVN